MRPAAQVDETFTNKFSRALTLMVMMITIKVWPSSLPAEKMATYQLLEYV